MGMLDVVKKAQIYGPADARDAGLCALKPIWLEVLAEVGDGDLVSSRGVPPVSEFLQFRIKEEGRLVAELNQKPDDSLSCSSLEELLRPYLEQVLYPNPNPRVQPSSDKRKLSQKAFFKLLKQASPILGQRLLSSILRAGFTSRNWDVVRVMVDSNALNGNAHPDFISTLIDHDQAMLICMWLRNVRDPRFSDLLLVLKYFLKSSLRASKSLAGVRQQWRQSALVAIQRISEVGKSKEVDEGKGGDSDSEHASASANGLGHATKTKNFKNQATSRAILLAAAVDHFQPFELCLHYLVSFGHDEAVLASIVSQLDNSEVLKLLHYLKKWLDKYTRHGSLCTFHIKRKDLWVPSLGEVLQWFSVLVDVHLMSMVFCSDFHGEIQAIRHLIKDLVDLGNKFAPLVGAIEHLRTNAPLPMQQSLHGEDDHVIEFLKF